MDKLLITVVALLPALFSTQPAAAQAVAAKPAAVAPINPVQKWVGLGQGVRAQAGAGQAELRANFEAAGLKLNLCARQGCGEQGALVLPLPPDAISNLARATLEVVQLGQQRSAVHAKVPFVGGERAWEAVVAAPVDGAAKPKVLWQGVSGWVSGELGERKGPLLVTSGRTVLLGEGREDISLCGRPTVLNPRAVVAKDLSLHPAKVQRLSVEERSNAPKLVATPDSGPAPTGSPLQALAASSAVGSPQALTDGKLNTFWGENRGGDGRGEFVTLRAPKQLGLSAFRFQVHPGDAAPATGAAPKTVWLVTDRNLFQVSLPQNAWQANAAAWRVDLPSAVHTECVALVLDEAYAAKEDSQVIVAELWGITSLGQNWNEVAKRLDDGAELAQAAADALRFGGEAALLATAQAFAALGPGGQLLALEVLDQASCAVAAPAYWAALNSTPRGERSRVQPRVLRCRREVGALLLNDLESQKGGPRLLLIKELAEIAPEILVEKAPQWLKVKAARERGAVRQALLVAADHPSTEGPLRALLRQATLPAAVQLELLRALATRAQRFAPEYGAAFRRQTQNPRGFESQYLLLQAAGALAGVDTAAAELIQQQLQAATAWELRGEAVRHANPKQFQAELIAATEDTAMRVRLAAVETLSVGVPKVSTALLARLESDEWPVVRAAAVRALLHSPGKNVDQALGQALEDESRHVRRPAAHALGQRKAKTQVAPLRDRLQDEEEDPNVRAAAALALGQVCDRASVDVMTDYARVLANVALSERELLLGRGALQGLARLKPRDLKQRLAPLLDAQAPAPVRRLARQALERPGGCVVAKQTALTGRTTEVY